MECEFAFGTICAYFLLRLSCPACREQGRAPGIRVRAGLEQAEIERLLGGAPRLSIEDIVKHPRLPEARKLYLDRFLEVYGGDPFLVRLLIESGRFILYHLTV